MVGKVGVCVLFVVVLHIKIVLHSIVSSIMVCPTQTNSTLVHFLAQRDESSLQVSGLLRLFLTPIMVTAQPSTYYVLLMKSLYVRWMPSKL